jgi:ATP-dependent DNA helicase RecQ
MQRRPEDALPLVLAAIGASRGAVLIYGRTRRTVEQWAAKLTAAGVEAIAYHAGMDPESRLLALEHFQLQPSPVRVATVAFGMGVDRPDVGLVLHLDLPASAEGYLQESGRAGRDGLPARCLVLYDPADRTSLGWAIRGVGTPPPQQDQQRSELAQQQLRRMEAVAEGEGCREQALLLAIGELAAVCGRCDNCQGSLEQRDWATEVAMALEALEARKGRDLRSLAEELAAAAPIALRPRQEAQWGWLLRRLVRRLRPSVSRVHFSWLLPDRRACVSDAWRACDGARLGRKAAAQGCGDSRQATQVACGWRWEQQWCRKFLQPPPALSKSNVGKVACDALKAAWQCMAVLSIA